MTAAALVDELHRAIVADLVDAGSRSPYVADANEPDPRYLSYGVRAAGKKKIIAAHRRSIRALDRSDQLHLARALIESEFGEQQSVGLAILEPLTDHFTPDRFDELDQLMRRLRGWSKVDEFSGSLLRDVLFNHPDELPALIAAWNRDEDQWLRRLSVVLFTRKVAASGQFIDLALELCENLSLAEEDLVRKGVGWSLKDLLKVDRDRERVLDAVVRFRAAGASNVIVRYALKELTAAERGAVLDRSS